MNEVNRTLFIPLYGKAKVSGMGILLSDPTAEEIWEAGFHEMLPGDTLAIVEWPERAEEALQDCRLEVRITAGPGEDERCITLDPEGGFHSLDTLLKDMEHFGGSIE